MLASARMLGMDRVQIFSNSGTAVLLRRCTGQIAKHGVCNVKKILIAALPALCLTAATPVFSQAPPPSPPPAQSATPAQTPTAQGANEYRSSKLIGTQVYNGSNENIGEIDDLVLDEKGAITAVVVGVGGFLGMGEKDVAMPFNSLKLSKDEKGALKVVVESTKDSLKAMPAYTYKES
jgi:sporulation protein YlmC with PRC-barrel domain